MANDIDEDILTLIYSHIFDFEVLRATAAAIAIAKQHPLRNVVLRRLLQLPLRLSSENLKDSRALIRYFVRNVARAELVREIVIALGPSRKTIAENERFGGTIRPGDLERAERAEALVESLPELLRLTGNLQRLDWSKAPPPDEESLKALFEHSRITHISIDCSAGSMMLLDPSEPLDAPDAAASITPLLSITGPKVTSLDLRNVDEDVFKAVQQGLPALKNLQHLKLDLTCGVWDWDGSGSPQHGPTEHYRLPRISDHVQDLHIIITDLLGRQSKGPVELADTKKLKKLTVGVVPCFAWVCVDFVRVFSDFAAADLSSLTHLVIDDSIRDMGRWTLGGKLGESDWQEGGRAYVGIHELISNLPQLRHLWVNERVLAVPSSDDNDTWSAKPFEGDPQETIMSRTVESPHWEPLGRAFEKLESLRVGFGPLNAKWAANVLSHCDPAKLKAFGFDWEWQPDSDKPDAFSELIETLSRFESLTDLHILHPYAALPTPVVYGDSLDHRLVLRSFHESERMKDLVKEFFLKLPGLYLVGIGRNSVWERQTRWKEGDGDEFPVQKLHKARVPSFYDAGSSNPITDLEECEYPAVKEVLNLLQEL